MATTTAAPTLPAASIGQALAQRVAAALRAALRAALARAKARHDYRRMLELDDAHLCDIGTTRGDVRQALAGR